MLTGIWREKNIRVEFVYSPLFEMLAAMHVLCAPSHHIYRTGWYERVSERLPGELTGEICRLGEETQKWLILCDFAEWEGMEVLSVPAALRELEAVPLDRWNLVFREYGKGIGSTKKRELLRVMDSFNTHCFAGEFRFLEPFLKRIMEKECGLCAQRGLLAEVDGLHERIEVSGEKIILHKNRDYMFLLEDLDCIRIWGSTFLAPHLVMGEGKRRLSLILPIFAEKYGGEVPVDLLKCMNALGDATRLKILRALRREPASTQKIAADLQITQAAVSKQLKLLLEAGLVKKTRSKRFVLYEIDPEAVDFIQYRLCEFLG